MTSNSRGGSRRALFGTQLYPTPASLARKMLAGIQFDHWRPTSVLEPSAGAGDLIEAVLHHFESTSRHRQVDVDAIELDPELAAMLTGKGHRVIWDDFLTFKTWKRYDLIVMNPPFADGAKHLLKALDLQRNHGGITVCLLNAETLRNPYTRERRELLERLESEGVESKVEYVGGAFAGADRATDVEVAIVKVTTAKPDRTEFIKAEFRKAQQQQEHSVGPARHDQVVAGDVITDMIADFDLEAELGVRLIELWEQTAPLLSKRHETYSSTLLDLKIGNADATVNTFLTGVRHKAWSRLFEHPMLTDKLTVQMANELHQRIEEFAGYDFNLHNIKTLQGALVAGLNRGIEEEAVRVFDTLSQQHALSRFSKNIHYYNGWKTNDAWQVNRRVIIPTYLGYFHKYSSGAISTLADIEQVLNFFDGMARIERKVTDLHGWRSDNHLIGQKVSYHYFDATVYGKGTIHITFRCPELVKRLNVFAGKHYNMLPPDYGAKPYQDLDDEHRKVVDDFEGEQAYGHTRLLLTAGNPRLALGN